MSEEYERERTTVTTEPTRTVEVRRSGSSAGWWVAALVAIVAIVAVIFMYNSRSGDDLQAARDAARTEAMAVQASQSAQDAASVAAQAAQDAAAGAAAATENAAQAAAEQTRDAAAAASDAGRDAAAEIPPVEPQQR